MASRSRAAWVVAVMLTAAACDGGSDEEASDTSEAHAVEPTVVLVHGSFHTPESTWSQLTPVLEARGIEWMAVDLPSAGPDQSDGALPDLDDDVAATKDAIEQVGGPVVLVGHSYGGSVITAAGVDPLVDQLVFLCAFAPEPGESTIELTMSGPSVALGEALRIEGGLVSVDPALAVDALYGDVDRELAATMVAELVPSTLSSLEQPTSDAAWTTVPATYVVCQEDRAIAPERQREMADRIGAETFSLPTSHSPFLSQPEAVADVIEQVVQQAGA